MPSVPVCYHSTTTLFLTECSHKTFLIISRDNALMKLTLVSMTIIHSFYAQCYVYAASMQLQIFLIIAMKLLRIMSTM